MKVWIERHYQTDARNQNVIENILLNPESIHQKDWNQNCNAFEYSSVNL